MKKRLFALFLSVLLLATVLCACGDTQEQEEGGFGSDGTSTSGEVISGGELVVGISQDLGDSLDPYHLTAAGTREVLFNVYEGLVKADATGEYQPAVASDYSVSEDGLVYTFPLREGVQFHNGDTVTTDDVIYSYETCAATTDQAALETALSAVESVEADGDSVVITLSEANPDFLSYAAMVYIVPDDYTEQATSPVGTGPFRFVSRSVQESMVLEKFDGYWGEGAYLDQVTFKIYEDANALMSALSAGSVDMAAHLTIDQVDSVAGDNFQVLEGTMNLVQALYLNNAIEPFDNELVRQAMCYAVDVDQILELTSEGHGTKVGTSIYPAFTKYFDESLADYYTQDVEKAKSLLEEAGYPDGFEMTITVPSNYTPHMNVAEVLVEQLAQVGIQATIQPVEWETWLSDVYVGRDFQSTVIGFDAATLSAGSLLNRWMSDNDTNMIGYNNPDYDDLMAQANACTDEEQQTALYKEAAQLLTETAANVYIQDLADFVLLKNDLDGYEFYPLYVMDLSTVHYVG
jgi:peptide/nickel transport system substrate-binding protein